MSAARIQIQGRDLSVLADLLEARVMTSDHVAAVHFDGRREAAKKRLQKLRSAGYIADRRRSPFQGSVHEITRRGIDFLRNHGALPAPAVASGSDRGAYVSDATLRHELEVVDVRVALNAVAAKSERFRIVEFTSRPELIKFRTGRTVVKPDAFIRIADMLGDGRVNHHSFFLELDRSTETQGTLAARIAAYHDHYRSGGFAERCGSPRAAYKEHPFRVLIVLKSVERLTNTAQRLLLINPPVLTLAWLSTLDAVNRDPLGDIWVRPADLRGLPNRSGDTSALRSIRLQSQHYSPRDADIQHQLQTRSLFPPNDSFNND